MAEEAIGSREIARMAILIALSPTRQEEKQVVEDLRQMQVRAAAIDYGGEFISSVMKMVERAVVAAKREGVIGETHHEEGAVAGAAREAVSQVMPKAIGLNVGGKIGIARYADHVAVAVFLGLGLMHLNEVAIGLGHRTL